eukprot:15436576-Alexandrium_andersonii.AAC.1
MSLDASARRLPRPTSLALCAAALSSSSATRLGLQGPRAKTGASPRPLQLSGTELGPAAAHT